MRATSAVTRSAYASSHVISHASPSGPCSACSTTSIAASCGRTEPSPTTTTSDGPANDDGTPTTPATSRLARATYTLPGPTMTSTGRIVSVPYAIAATAWAPPMASTVSTPAIAAAARTSSGTVPSRRGGTHSTTSGTPATRAGIAVMSTVDG